MFFILDILFKDLDLALFFILDIKTEKIIEKCPEKCPETANYYTIFMRWKISTNTVDGYKTDTKCAHAVHGRPTLKDEERFRNGLVRKPYERSLYERTFLSV